MGIGYRQGRAGPGKMLYDLTGKKNHIDFEKYSLFFEAMHI
jgi:hypothetical protein